MRGALTSLSESERSESSPDYKIYSEGNIQIWQHKCGGKTDERTGSAHRVDRPGSTLEGSSFSSHERTRKEPGLGKGVPDFQSRQIPVPLRARNSAFRILERHTMLSMKIVREFPSWCCGNKSN